MMWYRLPTHRLGTHIEHFLEEPFLLQNQKYFTLLIQ